MWHRYWKKFSDSSNGCKVKEALIDVVRRYLTSPPTSTNVERLFSYAGMVMEDRRALLLPERVNRILFLRENLVMMNFKLDWWNLVIIVFVQPWKAILFFYIILKLQ